MTRRWFTSKSGVKVKPPRQAGPAASRCCLDDAGEPVKGGPLLLAALTGGVVVRSAECTDDGVGQ